MPIFILIYLLLITSISLTNSILFSVPESVPIGHIVGYVEGSPKIATDPRFFVVYSDDVVEKIIRVDERTGEIVTLQNLDYEKKTNFDILVIPVEGGDGIPISIEVEDENDHVPTFPEDHVTIEISEFARIGSEYPLPLADDRDGPSYNVQKYRISQGNVNNVFKITTRRLNGILYADLVINGQLDREYRDKYELMIEAIDGGKPPKIGRLRLNINILDANDNVPIFEKPRYSVLIPSTTTIGSSILTVKATDADIDENARLTYRLQKTRSSSSSFFSISPSGVLTTLSTVPPGSVYDLVVVATDHGKPPLEATTFVTVNIQGSNMDAPALDIIWLTDTATAHLMENVTLGSIVARISVHENQKNSKVILSGCPSLCIQQSDSSRIYLLLICGLFDRETISEYHLKFLMKNIDDDTTILEHPVLLTIGDVNDNAPQWSQINMHLTIKRNGDNDHVLDAVDPDQGANGRIRYSVLDTDLIKIDPDSGRLIIEKELDCSIGPIIKFRVRAEDNGKPPKHSDITIIADLIDSNGKPPQFEKSLYEVLVQEDAEKGSCLLKVKANNTMCGNAPRVHYAFQDNQKRSTDLFSLDSTSGTICLEKMLDYETASTHQLVLTATDQNGQIGICFVSIRVIDVNDNSPIFNPSEYNISIREGDVPTEALLNVAATDADEGILGEVFYSLATDDLPFRIDRKSGEVYASDQLRRGKYQITVIAVDGNGAASENPATINLNVIARDAPSPVFTQSRYTIHTSEDILPGISIGTVQAIGKGRIRYSISSGNTGNQFIINPENGRITVARYLDADISDTVLLNVQADLVGGGTNHTQVLIEIDDHNDNYPVFPMDTVDVTIKEDQPIHEPFYIVHATDKDKRKNGEVSYSIISSHPTCPIMIHPSTGQLQLTATLDYERIKFYRIRVKAFDAGIPAKSANMTVLLHLSDVNDNAPIFEKEIYNIEVVENSVSMVEILRVNATDIDSDENGIINYRITNGSDNFGIDEKSGSLYCKKELDREKKSEYNLTILAEDRGHPSLSSTTTVRIRVLDVNDNAPSCSSLHTLVVPISADTTTSFGSIVITDPDYGENSTVVYRAQQTHQLFHINSNGDVRLRRKLTDLDPNDFRISVIASDNGHPRKSSVCHVPIKVAKGETAVQLAEPFERTIRIPLNCTSMCYLKEIKASGVHKWLLQSSEVSNNFLINNGILKLISLPSTLPPWHLVLVLSDKEGRQKLLTLKILPPLSKNLRETVSLSQSLPIGSKVAVIGDNTENGQFYYNLSNKTQLFELDEVSGTVYLSGRLKDHVGETVHAIYFRKVNIETESVDDILIEFQIVGNTEVIPKFEKDIIEIDLSEDTLPDTIIASTSADIPIEANLSVTYKLIDPTDMFAIDQYTGDISLLSTLEWFDNQHYSLVVEAKCGKLKSTQLIKINILDVNNNKPEIMSDDIVYVWPDSSRRIHRIVARDKDNGLNSQLKYELSSNPDNIFSIDTKTGEIFMEQFPSSEETLVVTVSDSAIPPYHTEQTIYIKLMNSSKRWHFFDRPEYVFTIANNFEVGNVIGKISGKGNANISPISMPKQIILSENEMKLQSSLANGEYRFSVLASSLSQDVDWATVLIIVSSAPEPPRISSASCGTVTIPENKAITGFKRVIGQNIERFMLQTSNSLFDINSVTGHLSCLGLDRESKSEHFLVIIAEGNGKNDSCTIKINVADENDCAPQFSASTSQLLILDSSIVEGSMITQLTALDLDLDENSMLVFELLEDTSMMLDIDPSSGKLYYKRNLVRSQDEWMIRVRVSDQGNRPLSSDRFIRVRDERKSFSKLTPNEAEPAFLRENYISDVDEGLDRGQKVLQVGTINRDARITYSIVEGNIDGAFEIDSDGFVKTAQELDFEIRPKYQLRVIGTGPFPGEIATIIDIKVNDINDNPPAFPKITTRKILESIPVGSLISTLSANDVDQDSIIEYYFETDNNDIAIDRYTGVIHTIAELDYEKNSEINLKVIAFDGKYKTTGDIQLLLIDINDNSPIFTKPFYDIQVHPNANPDDILLKVQAIDKDSGDNGKVSYSLERHEEQFSITSDGSIILHSSMALSSQYLITVTAFDHGNPHLSSSVPIRLTVTNKQPSARPSFPQKQYNFIISENMPINAVFGNISVSTANLHYRILDGDISNTVEIDRLGRLMLRTPIDRERKETYEFEVDVGADGSMFYQNSTTSVRIQVTDENDNSPKFSSERLSVLIRNGIVNGDLVYRLNAQDDDSGDNSRVTYRILTGNDYHVVSLEPETGAILFNEWNDDILNKYTNGSWVMIVEAVDHGHPQRSTIVYLDMSIAMSTWSSTAPFFVQSKYTVHIPENTVRNTTVFTARAVNRAGIPIQGLRYSIKNPDQKFSINSITGAIELISQLDFETNNNHQISVVASDRNARSAVVLFEFKILPCDEYAPTFTKKEYKFQVPLGTSVGSAIGRVQAVDSDGGSHGHIRYSIDDKNSLLEINSKTGILTLRSSIDHKKNLTVEKVAVTASSSSIQSTKTIVYLEIGLSSEKSDLISFNTQQIAIFGASTIFIALLLLVICCFCCRPPVVKEVDNPRKQIYSVTKGKLTSLSPNSRMPHSTEQLRNVVQPTQVNSVTSSLLTSSELRSALSNRDFPTNRSQPDSGIDPDNASLESSVTDYLVSLGVHGNQISNSKITTRQNDTIDSNLNDLTYARVYDVIEPGKTNGVSNIQPYDTAPILTPIFPYESPLYQPLNNIFQDVKQYKDSHNIRNTRREYVQIEI